MLEQERRNRILSVCCNWLLPPIENRVVMQQPWPQVFSARYVIKATNDSHDIPGIRIKKRPGKEGAGRRRWSVRVKKGKRKNKKLAAAFFDEIKLN